MKVRIRQTKDGYVVPSRLVSGTYPTAQAAARAAWNMRHYGAPDDPITPAISADRGNRT